MTSNSPGAVPVSIRRNRNTWQRPSAWGSESDQFYVVLYGTGLCCEGADISTAQIDGVNILVSYTFAQGRFAGLDQVNLAPLPRSLQGKGDASVVVDVDGKADEFADDSDSVVLTVKCRFSRLKRNGKAGTY
jgi:hypothetical protein